MTAKILQFRPKAEPAKVEPQEPTDDGTVAIRYCPFCGSEPRLNGHERVGAQSMDAACYVACTSEDCNVMTPYCYKTSVAIEIWNRRA